MRSLLASALSTVGSRSLTKPVVFVQRLLHSASRPVRIARATGGNPAKLAKKAKPPPPTPEVIPPPNLPPKGSEAWENCMLLIDKPLEWTSQDVCAKLKRTLDVKKIGHAGTLDPLATGLLIICIGKGTKSSERLMASEKVYTGTMRLGQATPSYDAETEPSEDAPWEHITDTALQAVATDRFTGDIMQVPPAYSAVKVGGRKGYRAARSGKPLEIEAKPRIVQEFAVWRDTPGSQDVSYRIRCGKGTYVRSLVHDLGEAVSSKAHVRALRRQSSGAFSVADAWALDDLVASAEALGLPRPLTRPSAPRGPVATDAGDELV